MNFLQSFSLYAAALALGALGALYAGNGGIRHFGLEGVMLAGGLAGVLSSSLPTGVPLAIAGAAGAAYSLILGFALIRRGNQYAAGLAVNGMAAAIAMIAARLTGGFRYSRKAFLLTFDGGTVSVFLPAALILLLAGWLLLYHTRWGLRLRACGEAPEAAENLGASVSGLRLSGMILSGFFAGIGGAACLVALGGGWSVESGLGGAGFLALAAAALGGWKPFRVVFAALVFALLRAGLDQAAEAGWMSADLACMLSYLASAFLLIFTSRKKLGSLTR